MNTLRRGMICALLVISFLLIVSSHGKAQCIITNGDFEGGTLAGWTQYNRPAGTNWFNWGSTVTPLSSHTISAPPQGTKGVITDHIQATTHVLYQDVTIPAGQSATLSFYLYYNNTFSSFVTLNTLDWVNNQQFRVDMMKTTSTEESVATSDVLTKLYQSKPGDPLIMSPTLQTYDLSGLAGLTVRLRLAEAVGISYMPIGFDSLCISTTRTTLTRPTAAGSNVQPNFGDVALNFPTVTTAGTTSLQQLDPAAQTGAPIGDTFIGPFWDISTTAIATTPINVCFTLPSITDATTFGKLRMVHKEAGIWIDLPTSKVNFTSKQLCAQTLSLSPFGVATGTGPTAADSTVSGTIVDNNGSPIEGVAVRMSGAQNRLTITDAGGFYHFDNVDTNGIYTVTPSRTNFNFTPSQKSFTALGQNTDAAFSATSTNGTSNPLDTTEYFVRQQYVDFLGREPDEAGFNFWVNNIESCGSNIQCRAGKCSDTSAAFFLSTEFQQTGYLVYRMYESAYGDMLNAPVPVTRSDFQPDSQAISNGVIVNQTGWQDKLEANKQAFALEFVQRARFASAYPTSLTPEQFVDTIYANAGVTPSGSERSAAVAEFNSAATSGDALARSRALRKVAENSTLTQQDFNRAFVLMQYFGYLRRDPNSGPDADYSGYNFWLNKLDSFNGNYGNAQMVEAFLVAGEYRQRFPR